MGSLIWTGDGDDDAIELGNTFQVMNAFGEIIKVSLAGDRPERWEYLASLLDNLEQTPGPEWLAGIARESVEFLAEFGDQLSPFTVEMLDRLAHATDAPAP